MSRGGLALRALLAIGLAGSIASCTVDPYCLDCEEDSGSDAGTDGGAGISDATIDAFRVDGGGPVDSGPPLPDGCSPGAVERCNDFDDDCDLMVDEGIDTEIDEDNCGACGERCHPAHAFGECTAGTCGFTTCDVGYYDLDGNPSNGCEYRCIATDPDDVRCDLRDNDCDGNIDEDVMLDVDPANCGSCGRTCRFAHAMGTCVASLCALGACDPGFVDADGNPANGCEYTCIPAVPAVETCNLRDDDCDTRLDEGDPGGGATCGNDVGECALGLEHCVGGAVTCTGGVSQTVELCNGDDDDCDGTSDEANPEGGRLCGSGTGTCEPGREVCTAGALVCTGIVGPATELCNGLDDDCDGGIDNGDPGGGASCGVAAGECAEGSMHCRGGVLACEMAVGPSIEICDGQDDDCDGATDEGNPGGGTACSTDVGTCIAGTRACTAGAFVCTGGTGPVAELCDALDNDCDGRVDEGNPGGGGNCGIDTGECAFGMQVCTAGSFVCTGAVGPTTETCDGQDDDCDTRTDEGNPGGGAACGSDIGACTAGARVCSGGALVCMGGTGAASETCDSIDNDCDSSTDEGNPGGGGSCGIDTGECSFGTQACVGGALVCGGGTGPTAEICDGQDDDCDALTDEGNPGGGGTCGTDVGACSPGARVCSGGALVCVGGTGPLAESCDSVDNDCDSTIDEGNPGGGGSCGVDTGECVFGSRACVGGALVCTGGSGPTTEICDNQDDDCDGTTDEGNPGGGGSCGSDVGTCTLGSRMCSGGAVVCVPGVGPVAEACDALDNDCDSTVDEGNPGGGGACGTGVGECTPGVRVCSGGSFNCDMSMAIGPTLEACDLEDDDCDGLVDEGFFTMTDPNNCSGCGIVCALPFTIPSCMGGVCGGVCVTGHYDINPGIPGCEYACDPIGAESCNGRDDDCDGRFDETLTTPSGFCNGTGVCAGTIPTCPAGPPGVPTWQCTYPPATYQVTETRCDGLDNDCDGTIDDPYPTRGQACTNGAQGACLRNGMFICNAAQNGVICNAAAPPAPGVETCDGTDQDCNGVLDNLAPANWVQFTSGGSTRWIMQYEASRPNATALIAGSMTHRACSEPNRLPWTQITHDAAETACATIAGSRLCTETEWRDACRSSLGTCRWSYPPPVATCTTYAANTCNGNDFDTSGAGGDQDAVRPTMSMPMCYANWGAMATQRVYDMSGNVEEWAAERAPVASGINPIRGGSTLDPAGGLECDFNFQVAGETFQTTTLGFRCCRSAAP